MMTGLPSSSASSGVSDDDSDKSFSDTEPFARNAEGKGRANGSDWESQDGWELDYIEESRITTVGEEEEERVGRSYKLKFKGYDESEWQPENNVDALELVRCFWENILIGQEACIHAQQALLVEIADRPEDSSDREEPMNKNKNKSNNNNNYNKEFKHRKQLKPRKKQTPIDSDLAESDSDSSSSSENHGSSDKEDGIAYSIPSHLYSQLSNHPNIHGLNPQNSLESCQHTYKPRTTKIRKQMRNELCEEKRKNKESDTNSFNPKAVSLSSGIDGIDFNSIYKYKVKNLELTKQVETLMEEIKSDTLKINEIRNRRNLGKNNSGRKLKLICEQPRNPHHTINNTSSVEQETVAVPTRTSTPKSDQLQKDQRSSRRPKQSHENRDPDRSRSKSAGKVQDENQCSTGTNPSIARGILIEESNAEKASIPSKPGEDSHSVGRVTPKKLRPLINTSHINNIHSNTSSPTCHLYLNKNHLNNKHSSRTSSQPTLTSSNQNFSDDQEDQVVNDDDEEEEDDDSSIFLTKNNRIKRKYIDDTNMKFSTFNQNKKKCFRKNSIRWAA